MDDVLDIYISNAEDLISHISTSETPLSDHKHVEIFLSYNPCFLTSPTLPDFSESSFRNLDFDKTDFEELNVSLRIIDWETVSSICKQEEFPQLFKLILLQMCELYCPRKVSPRVQSASSTSIHSRKKRKLAKQLEEAKSSVNCPQARIDPLRSKMALAHLDIRDAINEDLLYHEQQAVSKVKENPKFFTATLKSFLRKKAISPCYLMKTERSTPIPTILLICSRRSFYRYSVIPQKHKLIKQPSRLFQLNILLLTIFLNLQILTLLKPPTILSPTLLQVPMKFR